MKFDHPEDPRHPIEHTLLISCPNNGGLVSVREGLVNVIDHVDSIGLHASAEIFIRSYQLDRKGQLDIFSDDGMRTLVLPEVEDLHDILVHDGRIYAISTGTNEVLVYNLEGQLIERITRPGEKDAWHLNCIHPIDGKLVVSAFGDFALHREWANGRSAGRGFVIPATDITAAQPLLEHLDQPHTPRLHQGALYCCDSCNGSLIRYRDGHRESLTLARGFTRGIAFCGEIAYVGLSVSRRPQFTISQAEIAIIDLTTFSLRAVVPIPFREIYDITVVSDARLATITEYYSQAPVSCLSRRLAPRLMATQSQQAELQSKTQIQTLTRQIQTLSQQIDVLSDKIRRQSASASWKLTAPLRALRRLLQP